MTPFEIIVIVLLAIISVAVVYGVSFIRNAWVVSTATLRNEIQKCNSVLGYIRNGNEQIIQHLCDIQGCQVDIQQLLDKMHRNICADVAEKMVDKVFPIKEGEPLDKPFDNPFIPSGATTWPPCYVGDPCTNPHHDCINCPRPNVSGGTWTTTNNKEELTDNNKSANSVSITEGRTDVTDGTLPDGAIIMQ